MWRVTFRALSTDVALSIDEPRLARIAAGLVGTYAPARGEPTLAYGFEASGAPRLLRDGAVIYEAEHPLDLPPWFEMDFFHQVMDRCEPMAWVLHAAAVEMDGGAVVLAGASGSGKSTAALALVARGARYLTDEVVAIGADGSVIGLARPIAFAADATAVLSAPAGFARVHVPMREPGGRVHMRELLHPPASQRQHAPIPLRALAAIRYAPREPAGVRPLSPGQALEVLWKHTRNPGQETLDRAAAVLERVRPCEIVSTTVGGLHDAVQEVVTGAAHTG